VVWLKRKTVFVAHATIILMDPDITPEPQQTEQKHFFFRVTTFSKYLALALFVLLPFGGLWAGLQFVPVEMIEVERVVVKEAESNRKLDTSSTNSVGSPGEPCPFERNSSSKYIVSQDQDSEYVVCFGNYLVQRDTSSYFADIRQDTHEKFSVHDISTKDAQDIYGYDDKAFYVNGEVIYTTQDNSFEVYGGGFLRIEDALYGSSPVGLGVITLTEFSLADLETFIYMSGHYGKDKNSVYYSQSKISHVPYANSETFKISQLSLYSEPLGVDGEKLFFGDTFLKGLDASDTVMEGQVIYDSNTLWYETGGCHLPYFIEGELELKDTYYNC